MHYSDNAYQKNYISSGLGLNAILLLLLKKQPLV